MFRLIGFLFFCVFILIVIGFNRGWFGVNQLDVSPEGNKAEVKIKIDGERLRHDIGDMVDSKLRGSETGRKDASGDELSVGE